MGVYDPLNAYLAKESDLVVRMSFAEVERVLGRPLPASARKHRAWWSNEVVGPSLREATTHHHRSRPKYFVRLLG